MSRFHNRSSRVRTIDSQESILPVLTGLKKLKKNGAKCGTANLNMVMTVAMWGDSTISHKRRMSLGNYNIEKLFAANRIVNGACVA